MKNKKRMRCIDCGKLDFGFNPETDQWVHCESKHSRCIAMGKRERQPVIGKDEAYKNRVCPDFAEGDEDANLDLYETDIHGDDYEWKRKDAIEFQKMLKREASKHGIIICSI